MSLIITTGKLFDFFTRISTPVSPADPPMPPSPEWLGRFLAVSAEFDYWNGTPDDNAAIGLQLG